MDKYEQDTAEIARCGIRWREFGRFIHSPKALPVTGMEFIEELRGTLGDHLTGHNMDNIIFSPSSAGWRSGYKADRNYGASPSGGALIMLWILAGFYATIN